MGTATFGAGNPFSKEYSNEDIFELIKDALNTAQAMFDLYSEFAKIGFNASS